MSHKSKGCNAERELIHLFWATGKWGACRVAGSGSMQYPAPDIIAASKSRRLVLECKACRGDYQYLTKEEVNELKQFADLTSADPVIAVRFNNEEWHFFHPCVLKETEKNFVVTRDFANKIGKVFKELIL